ncbi:MAG: lipid II:glycine glycyltransferase FemX, partial [Tumebacillaceae bacterium]
REEPGEACAVYYERGETRIFYSFIKRKIDLTDQGYFDIVTPYGYGGPHLEGDRGEIVAFYQKFQAFCQANRIVTETVRLHPLEQNAGWLRQVMDVGYIRRTTAVNLLQSDEAIRHGYSSNNLRNIKKAKQLGLEVIVGNAKEHLDTFIELYYETMDRNRAIDMYYFSKSYFAEQMKETPLGKPHLLFVRHEGELIAGVLLIIGQKYAHYHLGASRTSALDLRPNNLLFDAMIQFAKSQGAHMLHLGGGYQEDDGLIKFKASFTDGHFYDYHIGKCVHDPDVYAKLNQAVLQLGEANPNYFPLYRGVKHGVTKGVVQR